MTRPTFAAAAGFGVVLALGFVGFGCSSSTSSGTGGATGSGGATAAGGATGTGGKTGSGGATGAGGSVDAGPQLPMCASPPPGDKTPCDSNPSCVKNCGLNISALTSTERAVKACTCSGSASSGGMWACPSTNGACVYPKDIDLSCFNLPSPLPPCVLATDGGTDGGGADGGAALIKSGNTPCTPPNSEVCGNVCGSATANSYMDSNNNPKMGYCACIAGTYQCASVNEWPPPQ